MGLKEWLSLDFSKRHAPHAERSKAPTAGVTTTTVAPTSSRQGQRYSSHTSYPPQHQQRFQSQPQQYEYYQPLAEARPEYALPSTRRSEYAPQFDDRERRAPSATPPGSNSSSTRQQPPPPYRQLQQQQQEYEESDAAFDLRPYQSESGYYFEEGNVDNQDEYSDQYDGYLASSTHPAFESRREESVRELSRHDYGEPIVVGGLESVMAPQFQSTTAPQATHVMPTHSPPRQPERVPAPRAGSPEVQAGANAPRKRRGSESDAPIEPQRNSLLDAIRFSWLGGGRSQSTQPESNRNSLLATNGREANGTDLHSQALSEDVGVVMKGWLEKCGQQFKTWNFRFFVLREDGVLAYYADEQQKKLKGSINVGYGSKADISMQSNMIEKKNVFMIATEQRNMMISAPSQKMMTKWIAKLHAAGATPSEPWDPSKKTVKFFVRDSECPHEWKRYDDPTSYIHMEGCLLKRGHVNKNWKNRFFRIERGELRYYTENQEQLKGSVPLKGTIVSPGMTQCPDGRTNYFVLTSKDGKFEMHLNAPNEQSMHRWIEALQEAQTALGGKGSKGTVAGLALVVKRAEEIPLAKVEVEFESAELINIEMERRVESLIVAACPAGTVPVGSQLVAVGRRSILRESYAATRRTLRHTSFPLQLQYVLPPFKKGELIKKSRSGFENWKKRVIVVTNGEIHYYKQVVSANATSLKHRKSFSLYGCYLNLIHMPSREFCIIVARSPSDKLVLETRNEEERIEWASVIYCSIRMVTQGMTPGHIDNLQLEVSRDPSVMQESDLQGSFTKQAQLQF